MRVEPLPWDFGAIVDARARASPDLLDLGTGGGEWISSLPYRPPHTVATESWQPNIAVAETTLVPLGVEVVPVEPAPDNVEQDDGERRGSLPFSDQSFHLIVSRHEAYVPREVARVLASVGRFLTEQAAEGNDDDFYRLLELETPRPRDPAWTLRYATAQLDHAGVAVVDGAEATQTVTFADVGALVWYLNAIPWAVPGFSSAAFRDRLAKLHRLGPVSVRQRRFWLEASKEQGLVPREDTYHA